MTMVAIMFLMFVGMMFMFDHERKKDVWVFSRMYFTLHSKWDFKKYYIICPTIEFNKKKNFIFNFYGEKGKRVKQYFEYNSKDNKTSLSKKKLLKLIKNI